VIVRRQNRSLTGSLRFPVRVFMGISRRSDSAFGKCYQALQDGVRYTVTADPTVYVAGTGGEFGMLDLATGGFTSIGTLNPSSGAAIIGMGFGSDGNLYGLDFIGADANLYQIDITNANTTLVGSLGHNAYGATADAAGKMYVLSQDGNSLLYTLDPPSTTTTVVGPTGLAGFFMAAVNAGGSRFFAGSPNATGTVDLYSIGTTTGAATRVGDTGFPISNGLFVGDTLYGFDLNVAAIFTIDTTTGAATQVATYNLPNGSLVSAAAVVLPGATIPEPSTLTMAVIGGGGVLGYRWRRRRA
jgi:hypothetical protein